MSRLKQKMKLAWTKTIAPDVLHIALEPETEFNYIPGQFISLHFKSDNSEKDIKRSYSIANPPHTSKYIEFAISYQKHGIASESLFNNINTGGTIEATGPAGRLVLLQDHPKRYVLIATGTGVTPYRAMLEQIATITKEHNTKFLLIFGARTLELCLYYQEFVDFAAQNPLFDFHVFLSREEIKDQNNIYHGYVQTGFDKFDLNPDEDMVYLCGNPNMIDEAFPILTEKGFTAKTVRREKYISSK